VADLQFEKDNAVARVHEMHGELLETATGDATIQERDTWPVKEKAAQAVVDGTVSPAQLGMLTLEADEEGVPVEMLSQAILAKSTSFHLLVGTASKLRSQALKAIAAAPTVEYLDMVLEQMEQTAMAALANG